MSEKSIVPLSELDRRRRTIQGMMREEDMDGLLVIQRADLFYFSGTAQNGFLFIPPEGAPLLMVRKYMPRAREESALEDILAIQSVKEVPGLIQDHFGRLPRRLGLELDVMPVREFNFYNTLFQEQECVDASPIILKARAVKSPWEIEQIETAADYSRETFQYMRTVLRPGMSEMEFAGLYVAFAMKQGHDAKLRVRDYQGEGYPWHVLSGKSGGMVGLLDAPASGEGTSAAFPCGAGRKALAPKEPIMVDNGAVFNGYHVDETRMFAIGAMPEKARGAVLASQEIYDSVLERARPGVLSTDLFKHAEALAASLGYADAFLGPPGYKVTFVAHGVGLELVEPPYLAKNRPEVLQPGMTLAMEPKMVFEGEFCAGVESVMLITETGSRLISRTPVDIVVC